MRSIGYDTLLARRSLSRNPPRSLGRSVSKADDDDDEDFALRRTCWIGPPHFCVVAAGDACIDSDRARAGVRASPLVAVRVTRNRFPTARRVRALGVRAHGACQDHPAAASRVSCARPGT